MLAQNNRLTTKDVRYIQKQRNIIWTEYFGVLWIPQYANRRYHQCSVYIAADTVKKSAWRHQIKRHILADLESPYGLNALSQKKFYKLFIFLNKKSIKAEDFGITKQERDQKILFLIKKFQKNRSVVQQKLSGT